MSISTFGARFGARATAAVVTCAIYAALVAALFAPVLMGRRTLIKNGNSADQSFAWLSKVFAAAQQGELVLWDFTTSSGVSFIGELQTAPLYPLSWMVGLLFRAGDPGAMDFFLIIHYFLAALGFHLLCRTLGLSWSSAFVGAIIFAFASMIATRPPGQPNLFSSLIWLPWVAAAVQRSLRARSTLTSLGWASLAGAFLALSFLAGDAHGTILAMLGAFLLTPCAAVEMILGPAPIRIRQFAIRFLVCFAVLAVFALTLALPQIVAAEEYFRLSYKWYGEGFTTYPHVVPLNVFAATSIKLSDLRSLFTGEQGIDGATLYFTLTGIICAGIALAGLRASLTYAAITTCAGLCMLIGLTFAFSGFPPFGWIYHHLCVINLIRVADRGLFLFAFGAALLAAVGAQLARYFAWGIGARIAPSLSPLLARTAPLLLAGLCLFEIARWFPQRVQAPLIEPGSQLQTILDGPAVRELIARSRQGPLTYRYFADRADIPPNLGNLFPVLSAHGYRSSRTMAYHDFFDWNPQSVRMDRFGVKWWISRQEVPGLPVVAKFGDIILQERPSALPVFWLVDGSERGTPAPIESIVWNQNDVTVRFTVPVSGTLVFAQTQYPGWRATADGLLVSVKTFEQFMAIDLSGPARDVSFRYAPAWWVPTVLVSSLAMVSLVLLLAASIVSMLARFSSGRRPN